MKVPLTLFVNAPSCPSGAMFFITTTSAELAVLVKVNVTLVINSNSLTGSGSSSLLHDVIRVRQKIAAIKNLLVFIKFK